MRLYIAEKPSLARALADVLPKPHRKEEGCICLANGDVVSWCVGHLLELAEPEAYDAAFKRWRTEDLPIVPGDWQWVAKPQTRSQLKILQKWIKRADEIVHVGDPDREGQLLVDEVLHYSRLTKTDLATVKRCLINDLNPAAVSRALVNLRSNSEFSGLSKAALARLRADWLFGINLTRSCTLQGQKRGFSGLLSVGRVQTPILGLIVRRDIEIEKFQPKPFYELFAKLRCQQGQEFLAKWRPSEACLAYGDEQGRILSRKLVENVAQRIQGQDGVVAGASQRDKPFSPPLPFNLSSLQVEAGKLFGASAKTVLDSCQSLYERHKLITYPRSDCRYLPVEHFAQGANVLAAVNHNAPHLKDIVSKADLTRRSAAWNDKKISAHHAIIPTLKSSKAVSLTAIEQQIYDLIARQYTMQFLTMLIIREQQIEVNIGGGLFVAKHKQTLEEGWRIAQLRQREERSESAQSAPLPILQKGDLVACFDSVITDKMTSPPKAFTDGSLMAALTGIARYVQDAQLRKILRDTDGIGTEATRAAIIELLFLRSYTKRQGKNIIATELGRKLIEGLPESMTRPDITAHWERQLVDIQERKRPYQEFMAQLLKDIQQLLQQVEEGGLNGVQLSGIANTGKSSIKRKPKISRAKKTVKKSRSS